MVLIDTSVLISFFKKEENEKSARFEYIIANQIPFGICRLIYQEILQGSRTDKEFELLKKYLSSQRFYELLYGLQSIEQAASINLECRKNGITVRSTIDLLIVEIVLENKLMLLHNDNDFDHISKVIKDLKFF